MNVGQFRRADYSAETFVDGYVNTSIGYNSVYADSAKYYYNTCLNIENGALSSTKSYFLKFTILPQENNSEQTINVKLKMRNDTKDEMYQNIKTVKVTNRKLVVDVLFTPNAEYDQIVLELSRTPMLDSDVLTDSKFPNGMGRIVELETTSVNKPSGAFYGVTNMIQVLQSKYPDLRTLAQIGIRTHSQVPICINGEEIFVGPSGIYEIYNGLEIDYLGFVVGEDRMTADGTANFIVDFLY